MVGFCVCREGGELWLAWLAQSLRFSKPRENLSSSTETELYSFWSLICEVDVCHGNSSNIFVGWVWWLPPGAFAFEIQSKVLSPGEKVALLLAASTSGWGVAALSLPLPVPSTVWTKQPSWGTTCVPLSTLIPSQAVNYGEVGTPPEGTFPVLPLSPEKGQAPFFF